MPVPRRLLFALVAVPLVWLAVAQAAPGDPKKRIVAADQAYAKSVLLRKVDLPTGRWEAVPTSFTGTNPSCVVKRYSLSALTATGETGFTYTQERSESVIESNARVFRSGAQAGRAFSILSSVGLGRCLGSALVAEIDLGPQVAANVARVEPLSFVGLAARARGFRIVVDVRSSRSTTSLHYALVSVHHRRGVASLGLLRAGSPWPSSVVRSLAARTATLMTKR